MGIEDVGSGGIENVQGGPTSPYATPLFIYFWGILSIIVGLQSSILYLLSGLTLLIAGTVVLLHIAQTGEDIFQNLIRIELNWD